MANPVFATESAGAPPPQPPVPAAPLLGYAKPDLGREPRQSAWAVAALVLAGITAVYTVACGGIAFSSEGWDVLAWFVIAFIGNWIGAGLGLICGLVGCLQRRRLRSRSAHSLWVNAMVAAAPTLIAVPALFDGAQDLTPVINVFAAWVGAFLGILSGVILGFWYHRPDWLGGYASWPRRLLRLGHLSFFGLAGLNLAYALTLAQLRWTDPPPACSIALAAANFLMPLACAVAAFRPGLRHMLAIPVVCTLLGVGGLLCTQVVSALS